MRRRFRRWVLAFDIAALACNLALALLFLTPLVAAGVVAALVVVAAAVAFSRFIDARSSPAWYAGLWDRELDS